MNEINKARNTLRSMFKPEYSGYIMKHLAGDFAVELVKMLPVWRPIKTAPKTSVEVVVFDPAIAESPWIESDGVCLAERSQYTGLHCGGPHDGVLKPTLWMPKPKVPTI